MPSTLVQKLVDEGYGTKAELEKKWEDAKQAADKQGKGENYSYITSIFNRMVGYWGDAEEASVDTVIMDVPFLIRLVEWAREDAKTDVDLHTAVTNLIQASNQGDVITMKHYDKLIDNVTNRPANNTVVKAKVEARVKLRTKTPTVNKG